MTDGLVSVINAPDALLARLPPILLIIGGDEVLLGENLQFAQRVQNAGGQAHVEVWDGMWHDFIMACQV